MDAFIGEIRAFGFSYAPEDWAHCDGATLPVIQFQALYALIAGVYGSATQQTFVLPDLRQRAPLGVGSGPGLTTWTLGNIGGEPSVTLGYSAMPHHHHSLTVDLETSANVHDTPTTSTWLSRYFVENTSSIVESYSDDLSDTELAYTSISVTGGGQPHENRQPYQPLNYCICLYGIFPPRP